MGQFLVEKPALPGSALSGNQQKRITLVVAAPAPLKKVGQMRCCG
jgi:hypothetical protein